MSGSEGDVELGVHVVVVEVAVEESGSDEVTVTACDVECVAVFS